MQYRVMLFVTAYQTPMKMLFILSSDHISSLMHATLMCKPFSPQQSMLHFHRAENEESVFRCESDANRNEDEKQNENENENEYDITAVGLIILF